MPSDLPPSASTAPLSTDPQRQDAATPLDPPGREASALPNESRTFESAEAPDMIQAPRPQNDFGAPIEIGAEEADAADAPAPRPAAEMPPLIAAADDTATPHLAEPRPAPELTRRISQGMPSYSEPDPEIAGVVGRAARGGDAPVE